MAFFPCTRFEAKVPLLMRGEAYQQTNWDDLKKLEYSMKLNEELNENYQLLSMLTSVFIRREIKAVIENPYTQPHYLTTYWCIKPKWIDKNRTQRGDYYSKPTQFWFINCDPEHNFLCEPTITQEQTYMIDKAHEIKNGLSRQTNRSMISPDYANRFIREQIMNGE